MLDRAFVIENGVLQEYHGPGGDVVVPEGVTTIGQDVFSARRNIKTVVLPRSIRKLEVDEAVWGGFCGETALSRLKALHGIYAVMPEGLCQVREHLDKTLARQIQWYWSAQMTVPDWAGLYLFQSTRPFQELCAAGMKPPYDPYVTAMAELLAHTEKKASAVQKAVYFVGEHLNELQPESIRSLLEVMREKKTKKAVEQLEQLLRERTGPDPDDPYASFRQAFQEEVLRKGYQAVKGTAAALKQVRLKQSGEPAPAFLVLCAVVPYTQQYGYFPGQWDVKHEFVEVKPVELADQAAELLDRASLIAALEALQDRHSAWVIPYCRYGSGKEISKVVAEMNRKVRGGLKTRGYVITARGALLLSDTREAILKLDQDGCLLAYARQRVTSVDALRNQVLSDFGLDATGEKVYDLGGNTVTARLGDDLTIRLYDGNAKKTVKSLPKKNADPEKYEAAKADLAEIKKNLKKVVKARCGLIFADYLADKPMDAIRWKSTYPPYLLLSRVASLLVWSQEGRTFTLREGQTVDSKGQPYLLTNGPIQVAHPMEMDRDDLERWQKYFTAHGLKQPFAQVWEPVVDFSKVKADRYQGIEVPAFLLKDQEKHGIKLDFDYDVSMASLTLTDCSLSLEGGSAEERHYLNPKGNLKLGLFQCRKQSRASNHIIGLLDKWTVYGRILKDDVSAVEHLDSFTLAQVTELLNLAIEHNCTNCTAALLEYKNTRFADFDPMDVFTLE